MSRIESAQQIESIVGAKRHATEHMARAVSAEQCVYILHSKECVGVGIDLRKCPYSVALDRGIDMNIWGEWQDVSVGLAICDDEGDLLPIEMDLAKAVSDV